MRTRGRKAALGAALATVMLGSMAGGAQATYHENLITEVHQGSATATGDYVELQAYAAGQNLLTTHYVITYDGGNGPISTFQFPSIVANASNQATVLVANDASVTGADFIAPGGLNVVNTNGAVCFVDKLAPLTGLDCVDWGTPPGGGTLPSPAGTPVLANPTGLADNTGISRSIARGCVTALDLADDTNNSAADFAQVPDSPRGNSVTPTETPCPTPPAKKCKKKKKKKKGKSGAAIAKKKCKKKKKKK